MLKRVEGAGEAVLFRGDPRLPETDMDAWYNILLTQTSPAKARPWLYGADAGLCARRNVLLEHNTWIAGEKSPATNAYMVIGVSLEGMLVEALKRAGRLVATQLKLPAMDEVYVSGYIDILHFDSEDKLAITEVKTCGKLPEEPNPVHLAQVQFYAAATGIYRAWLTYISRNVRSDFGTKLSMRTFAVDCSELALHNRLLTAAISRLASDVHKLPPVPAHFRKHTECHYCEFRDAFCWRSRPGLGADEPQPPLPLLSPVELIGLEQKAKALAASMASNAEVRLRLLLAQLRDNAATVQLEEALAALLTIENQRLAGLA